MRKKINGSVTVLFSWVLVLLLSLVLVSVESARRQAAVAILQTDVSLAMSSLSGQYYAPLYDRFGIYGLYGEDVEESLKHYLKGSVNPLADLPEGYDGNGKSGYDFAFSEPEAEIKKKLNLTDLDGDLMRRQMISVGAVSGAEELVEELLQAVGLLKEQETGLKMLEEKAKSEEKLTAMDLLLLRLMTVLDGVPTNATGIVCDEDEKIHPEEFFAKRIVASEPDRQSVQIDSFAVFLYLKPKYVVFSDRIAELREERERCESSEKVVSGEWVFREKNEIFSLLRWTVQMNDESIKLVDRLMTVQNELQPLLTEYEQKLNSAEGLLPAEWKAALTESIGTMRKYAGTTGDFYDFPAMRERLAENRDHTRRILQCMEEYADSTSDDWRDILRRAEEELNGISFEGLSLRYGGVRRTSSVKDSFLKAVKNLVTQGMTSGILDAEQVSGKRLSGRKLPSETIGAGAFDLFDIPDSFSDLSEQNIWTAVRNLKLSGIAATLREGTEALIEKILLVCYAKTHFSEYLSEPDKEEPSVLAYQAEYVLFGKKSDSDNLRKAALCILGIRLLMNLVHTFTNPEKRARALTTATEVFAGIPFLIKGCQYVILFVWGLQNAKLEAAEILKGKKVPFLVTKSTFQTSYEEILTTDRAKRFERAEKYEDQKGAAPDYGTYITLFLLLSKEHNLVSRSMDLIQEQLRLTEDPDFLLSDCLCGLAVSVRAGLSGKYTVIPMTGFGEHDGCTVEASGTILY